MSNTTTYRVSSALDDDVSVSDLAEHVQSLTDHIDELEQEVAHSTADLLPIQRLARCDD